MASFLDITGPASKETRRFLKRDWSAVEKAFKEGIPAFVACLPQSQVSDGHAHSEGVQAQEFAPIVNEVQKKSEEIPSKPKGQHAEDVEYSNVKAPKEGALASQLAQPKEKCLSTQTDAFDDIFGTPSPTEPKKEQPKPEVGDVFASAESQQYIEISQPADVPCKPNKKACEEDPFTHGFDLAKFADVKRIAEGILTKATHKIDLDNLDKEYKEYAVEYSIDAYRANADTLSEHMANTQSKKDRVNTVLIELTSLKESYGAAEDMYESFGSLCSSASSKEKREAQVKYQLRDFYTKLAHVERLHAMYEQAERGLNRQIETLSRLLGIHLARRPGMPFEQASPRMEIATPPPQVLKREETRDACRPSSKRGLDGLDDFEPNPVIPKEINRGTEEVEF